MTLFQTPAATPPADSVRAVLHRVFAAPEYDWGRQSNPLAWVRRQFLRFIDWLDALRGTHPVVYAIILGAMIVALLAIVAHLAYVVSRAMRAVPEGPAGAKGPARRHDAAWYLAEARRLVEEGRYREALACRFVALVLQLDQQGAVRFHPSKTPAEYAREARLAEPEQQTLAGLVGQLYGYLFGGVTCSPDGWAAFDATAMQLGQGRAAS